MKDLQIISFLLLVLSIIILVILFLLCLVWNIPLPTLLFKINITLLFVSLLSFGFASLIEDTINE